MWARLKKRVLFFLFIMGPGIITANVDNDANGIATYSQAGSGYGYKMLWLLTLVCLFQIVVQEMCARMGCVTGKGLADLIRERFGVKVTLGVMFVLFFANLANTVGDFAGLAAGTELFGIPRQISVPLGAVFLFLLIIGSSYQRVEKVFLAACLIYVTYIISGCLARPDWGQAAAGMMPRVEWSPSFLSLSVALVGTTIAPWMQFFQQSAIRDKGIQKDDYRYELIDTVFGTIIMAAVGAFILIACAATIHAHGLPQVDKAEDAARALEPLAGPYARTLFGLGLINAALFSVSIIPLSTAYAICEAFGWESGVGLDFSEAPMFFGLYVAMLILGAALVMIPGLPLVTIMVFSQVINGALLPVILICMLLLISNRHVMGDWAIGSGYRIFSWICTALVIAMTVALIFFTLRG
jgi:NRAMP (natural resistance-associated macrophage protein)-like metal ion transporter